MRLLQTFFLCQCICGLKFQVVHAVLIVLLKIHDSKCLSLENTPSSRMSQDVKALCKDLTYSRNHRRAVNDNTNSRVLREWLITLGTILSSIKSNKDKDVEFSRDLKDFIYICDYSEVLQCATIESTFSGKKSPAARLSRIQHIVKQVKRIMNSVKLLVNASRSLPVLFHSYRISNVPSFKSVSSPLEVSGLTIRGMVERMLGGSNDQIDQYEDAITELEKNNVLGKLLKNNNWLPTLHAEILLAEFFYSHQLKFFANDPFIACSKAACYCCYYYLKDHPRKFIVPASHYNAYIRWKVPNPGNSIPGTEYRNEFLKNTTKAMREEVLDDMAKRQTRPLQRGDSW